MKSALSGGKIGGRESWRMIEGGGKLLVYCACCGDQEDIRHGREVKEVIMTTEREIRRLFCL